MEEREKRKYPRVPENIVFAISGGALPPGMVAQARVTDLSEGGAGLEVPVPVVPGQTITIDIQIPVRVQAHVMNVRNVGGAFRCGIRFEGRGTAEREVLRRYITRRLGKTP